MNDFSKTIEDLQAVLDNTPGSKAIFEGLESGDLTPAQAYTKLESLLKDAGADLKGMGESFPLSIPTENAVPMVLEGDNGLPMLNPLVEAAIAELASIDGDVPHMRSGPLPENATPAIPVETTSANPVMVGAMLQEAARQVEKQIRLAIAQREEAVQALEEKATETGIAVRTEDLPAPVTGVEHYRAGETPTAMAVAQPSVQELTALTPKEKRTAVHKALATTQGRTSLAPVIERLLCDRLSKMGVSAERGAVEEGSPAAAWTMHTYADDEIHEEFSPVEAAVASLTAKIKAYGFPTVVLKVTPFNGTSERHFGWGVQFMKGNE